MDDMIVEQDKKGSKKKLKRELTLARQTIRKLQLEVQGFEKQMGRLTATSKSEERYQKMKEVRMQKAHVLKRTAPFATPHFASFIVSVECHVIA